MLLDISFNPSTPGQWIVYAGFDPTAASLHVGNLMTLMGLWHFSWTGRKTIALIGGATGGIGDPSGKSTERNLIDGAIVSSNSASLKDQLQKLNWNANNYAAARSTNANKSTIDILDNRDWFKNMSILDFLRDTGRNFRLGNMLAKESVKCRLTSTSGMSFTEFSYQILQAYDFYYLYKNYGCNLQIGGSDQWGNILAGCDLISKKFPSTSVGGLTLPLVTTSDGIKFGKSEGNAIWLDSEMTSVFDFYQVRIGGCLY